MRKIIVFFRNILNSIILFPYIIKINIKKNIILCEGYFSYAFQNMKNKNWGDDLNKYLFEYVTDLQVVNLPVTKMKLSRKKHPYSLIGSIITLYRIDNKIIYGSGIMNPQVKLRGTPYKIISVRGPKTREVIQKNGIECPENYGDPALLLPLFYTPKCNKKNKGGIIANMGTNISENKIVYDLIECLNLKLIDLTNYNDWRDVIDDICECEYILSESLHGLIVAETYGIPNVWIELKNHPDYWDFKFEDYYESIKKTEKILKVQNGINKEMIMEKVKKWNKAKIDYDELLKLFPFDVKCKINKEYLDGNCNGK